MSKIINRLCINTLNEAKLNDYFALNSSPSYNLPLSSKTPYTLPLSPFFSVLSDKIVAYVVRVSSADVTLVASLLDSWTHRFWVLTPGQSELPLYFRRLWSRTGANCHPVLLPGFLFSVQGLPRRRSLLRNPSQLEVFRGFSSIHRKCIQAEGRVVRHDYRVGPPKLEVRVWLHSELTNRRRLEELHTGDLSHRIGLSVSVLSLSRAYSTDDLELERRDTDLSASRYFIIIKWNRFFQFIFNQNETYIRTTYNLIPNQNER